MIVIGPRQAKLILAFSCIYFIWGSTYLAIRFAIESIPPFAMIAGRSLAAGSVLFIWGRLRSREVPNLGHWISAAIIGCLLFLGGHGAVAWGEQRVPSGIASLLIATIPIWMALLQTLAGGRFFSKRLLLGLVLGFGGVVLLAERSAILGGDAVDPLGAVVLVCGALSWSLGSLYSQRADLPRDSMMTAGMNLLAGGVTILVIHRLSGESVAWGAITRQSWIALAYLVGLGSIVAFAAYIWLLRTTTASKVSTYAFVNPVIAVSLGWLAGGETLNGRIVIATLLMVAGVYLIVTDRA